MSTKFRRSTRRFARLSVTALVAQSPFTLAKADDAAPPPLALPSLVVSATRLPTPEDQLGSSVSVITADDIAAKQFRTLPEALQDVPGLSIVQTGGPGGLANVFLRGTNSNHTKVFIDGIDVGDPSSADGSFDFSQILTTDIHQIEVLRGPQSGLYGSDAIGGVISVTTEKGSGPPQLRATLEGGSFGTFNQTISLSGSISRFNYVADFAHYRSDDSPVTPTTFAAPGQRLTDDSYDNKSFGAHLGFDVTDNFDLGLVARYVETSLLSTSDAYDPVSGLSVPETMRLESSNHEFFTRATAHLALFNGRFDQTLGVGYTDYHRSVLDPNPAALSQGGDPNDYAGDRLKFDWQGIVKLLPGQVLTLGAEHQQDRVNDNAPVRANVTNDAGYIQLQSSFGDRFFDTVSVWHDVNGQFGGKTTVRLAATYLVPETDSKLKGSVGTGYKAPTLDELYHNYPDFGFFANPDLKPETSTGYDVGFVQAFAQRRVQFGATYFHNAIRNLIDYNSSFTSEVNIGRATTQGLETFVSWKPIDRLSIRADYTRTLTTDDTQHQELLRRPKNKASLNASWRVTDAASVSATILYVGTRYDVGRDGPPDSFANAYTLVNLAGSYDIGHGVTLFARLNNLTDRKYQDPMGYQNPRIGVISGLRLALGGAD